jgi:hypothetical protein
VRKISEKYKISNTGKFVFNKKISNICGVYIKLESANKEHSKYMMYKSTQPLGEAMDLPNVDVCCAVGKSYMVMLIFTC